MLAIDADYSGCDVRQSIITRADVTRIGIGARIAPGPLPHHLACGSALGGSKQIVVEQAARVVLLADHSKFNRRALCKVLDITQIDEVITDAGTAADDVAKLEQRGITVRVAPEAGVVVAAAGLPA